MVKQPSYDVQNRTMGIRPSGSGTHSDPPNRGGSPPPAKALGQDWSGDTRAKDPAADIDGMPPNYGEGLAPHVITFQGIISSVSRVYRPSDEAIKDSLENARFMLNDPMVTECIEQRQRSTALLDWHLEPDDDNDVLQTWLCEEITKIIKKIPRFMQYRENLLRALWYGRYGVQQRWKWKRIGKHERLCIDSWVPVNGDKIVFRYDDGTNEYDPNQVGIRVGAGFTTGSSIAKRWSVDKLNKVEPTDYGLAYFLEVYERDLLAIHKHMIEDGEYEDPQSASKIHGLGIRSRIYWAWYQKQEAMAWLMEYMERSAWGMEIWYYPSGNDEAEAKTRKAAEERIGAGRNIILVPRPLGEEGMAYGVERIEPGLAGADLLHNILQSYFGHQIKRYILGQTLTTEADSTGLGSNLASIHLDTYLQIVKYDAINLEETLTTDLVDVVKRLNWPMYADVPIHFKIETESPDVQGKLEAWQRAYEMGCKLKESDVMDLIGAAMPERGDTVLEAPEKQQMQMQEQQLQQQQAQQQAEQLAQQGMDQRRIVMEQEAQQFDQGFKQRSQDWQQHRDEQQLARQLEQPIPPEMAQYSADDPEEPTPNENSDREQLGKYSKTWKEADHPRDEGGKFSETDSVSGKDVDKGGDAPGDEKQKQTIGQPLQGDKPDGKQSTDPGTGRPQAQPATGTPAEKAVSDPANPDIRYEAGEQFSRKSSTDQLMEKYYKAANLGEFDRWLVSDEPGEKIIIQDGGPMRYSRIGGSMSVERVK